MSNQSLLNQGVPVPLIVNGTLTSSFEFLERICASLTHNKVQLVFITSPHADFRHKAQRFIMNRFISEQPDDFLEQVKVIHEQMLADGYTDNNDYVPVSDSAAAYPLDDIAPRGDWFPVSFDSYTYRDNEDPYYDNIEKYEDDDVPYTKENALKHVNQNRFLTVIHKDTNFFVGAEHNDFYDFTHYHVEYATLAQAK